MRAQRRDRDEGFSLIEVIIAMVMIGIVASSALWFFINGMRTSSNLGRQQTAVSIATSAMEQTFVVSPKLDASKGVSGLVVGRPKAAVASAFSTLAGLGVSGVSNSYPLSDPAGGTPVLPITTTVTRAGIDYTVYTLVGSCFRTVNASGAAQDCDKVPLYADEPTTPTGTARMLRVIVSVTWAPRGDECPSALCHYDVSTLVDPSLDLVWNRVFDPEAVDDSWSLVPGVPKQTLVVLSNDALGSVPVNPVQILTNNVTVGTLANPPSSTGTIDYTPLGGAAGTWVSGIFTFTYQIHDIPGKTSQATGSIKLLPFATNDDLTATVGVPKVLNIYNNDQGSPKTVSVTGGPSLGTLGYSGPDLRTLTYTATTPGFDEFTYTYTDAAGQTSPPATVRINVSAVSAADTSMEVNYRKGTLASDGWVDVSSALRGSADPSTEIMVSGVPTPSTGSPVGGSLMIDGKAYTGGTVTGKTVSFQPPVTSLGEWTFPFALSSGTYTSPTVKATMRVWLAAIDDPSVGNLKRSGTYAINVGANDFPKNWGSGLGVTVTQGTISKNCGTWAHSAPTSAELAAGQLSIKTPWVNSKLSGCTATYTVSHGTISDTATITYNVTTN